ncbi:ribonuclease H-like domain-containing protein [Tanacetum coccineum]
MAGDDASKPSSSGLSLTFGDPLYLHPNDTGSSPIVTVKLTGTKNYKVCSIAMTFSLRNHNKIGFIDGTCKKNDFDVALANQWDMCNSVVFTWILNSLTIDVMFLMDLGDNYLAIRSNILTREPLPLVKAAFAIVSGEESHRNITSNRANKPVATIFAAKFVDKKKDNNNNSYNKGSNYNTRGPNPNLKCTNCNKIRHTIDRCFEIVGYPAGYVKKNFIPNSRHVTSNNTTVDPQSNNANSNAASKSLVSLSNEQLTRLMNLLNDNGVSFANANMSDFVVGNISMGWIVDFGANQHMTISAKFLINVVDISNLGLTVIHPNGTQALITKIGDLKLNDNIILYDVLVVPKYIVSLLSVHKLLRDNKLFNLLTSKASKAKQTREPFPLSDHKSSKIDDFTRAVWVYMLKGKDYVYDSIDTFFSVVLQIFLFFVYGHDPSLSHFRVFGCLCYAIVLNNYDKFSSRDVKFYETVFPFKMKNNLKKSEFESSVTKELNHKNFFDNEDPKRPNDEGRVSSNDDGSELSPDNNNQGNNDSDATSMEETNNTHPEGNELPVNNLRRSSRQTKLPSSLNDFIVEGKVKYGVERVVHYANLNPDSLCFATALNKSIEPTCYEESVLDSNWIDAMNSKIKALNENHTWIITDLPLGRIAIGNK